VSEAEDLVRRAMEAHNRGGDAVMAAFDELFADDYEFRPVTVTVGAVGSDGAAYRGRQGMERYYRERAEVFESGEVHIRSLEALGDAVVVDARSSARGRVSGAVVEEDITLVYWYRDGRFVRGQGFRSREDALEAAGA
jgi:ketosteroid isomerase-like protein